MTSHRPSIGMHRAQFWQMDFIISLVIIAAALGMISINLHSPIDQSLITDAVHIASVIVSSGVPSDWNSSTVRLAGIAGDDHVIDEKKLQTLYAMSSPMARVKVDATHLFYIQILKDGVVLPINGTQGVGWAPAANATKSASTRLMLYQDQPVQLQVIVWK